MALSQAAAKDQPQLPRAHSQVAALADRPPRASSRVVGAAASGVKPGGRERAGTQHPRRRRRARRARAWAARTLQAFSFRAASPTGRRARAPGQTVQLHVQGLSGRGPPPPATASPAVEMRRPAKPTPPRWPRRGRRDAAASGESPAAADTRSHPPPAASCPVVGRPPAAYAQRPQSPLHQRWPRHGRRDDGGVLTGFPGLVCKVPAGAAPLMTWELWATSRARGGDPRGGHSPRRSAATCPGPLLLFCDTENSMGTEESRTDPETPGRWRGALGVRRASRCGIFGALDVHVVRADVGAARHAPESRALRAQGFVWGLAFRWLGVRTLDALTPPVVAASPAPPSHDRIVLWFARWDWASPVRVDFNVGGASGCLVPRGGARGGDTRVGHAATRACQYKSVSHTCSR